MKTPRLFGNPTTNLRRLALFTRRQFFERWHYRMDFSINITNVAVGALAASYFGSSISYQQGISQYDASALGFLVTGLAVALFTSLATALGTFINAASFETVLLTPVSFAMQAVCYNSWSALFTSCAFVTYLGVGYAFGVPFRIDIVLSSLVVVLTLLLYLGLAFMDSGVNLITKRGNPVSWLMGIFSGLLSGQLFPITVLPTWLRQISYLLPQTYLYRLWRLSILRGASVVEVWSDFLVFTIVCITFFLIGYLVLMQGIKKLRTEGVVL